MCDEATETCGAEPAEPELINDRTYCFVAVSYDTCMNPSPATADAKTPAELCDDDPIGAPGDGSQLGLTWPNAGTGISVSGCDASGGISVSFDTTDHTYPNAYFDGAKYRVHVKPGDATGFGVPDDDNIYYKTFRDAPNTTGSTLSTSLITSGLVDGETYSVGVAATDCAYENGKTIDTYSSYLTLSGIQLGRLDRDVKCEDTDGVVDLSCGNSDSTDKHREILTGVTIDSTDGNGATAPRRLTRPLRMTR